MSLTTFFFESENTKEEIIFRRDSQAFGHIPFLTVVFSIWDSCSIYDHICCLIMFTHSSALAANTPTSFRILSRSSSTWINCFFFVFFSIYERTCGTFLCLLYYISFTLFQVTEFKFYFFPLVNINTTLYGVLYFLCPFDGWHASGLIISPNCCT